MGHAGADFARSALDAWEPPRACLGDEFWSKISKYLELLEKFGKAANLTGALTPEALAQQVEEGVLVVMAGGGSGARSWIDVGSGGGFPGIIVAAALPETEIWLVEPREKRASFLEFVVSSLDLGHAHVRRGRIGPRGHEVLDRLGPLPREAEVASSRATFSPAVWLELGLRLVGPTGRVLVEGHRGQQLVPDAEPRESLERSSWRVEVHVPRGTSSDDEG